MIKSAELSPCGTYRYRLDRTWDVTLPVLLWVMLNPSTADASLDDPTIRRVIGFSAAWGYGTAVVANAFALRATDPKLLTKHPDPIGPDNDAMLAKLASFSACAVVAWGSHGSRLNRDTAVLRILRSHTKTVCLGTTAAGMPRHPLYLAADTALRPYTM